MKFFQRHKQPSIEAGIVIILLAVSLITFGFLTENRITGMAVDDITGNMVKVTGMDEK